MSVRAVSSRETSNAGFALGFRVLIGSQRSMPHGGEIDKRVVRADCLGRGEMLESPRW